jgi:hypothetical protein
MPLVSGGGSGSMDLSHPGVLGCSPKKALGPSWPSVVISRHHELLSIDITVSSGWTVEPGQYVYLWLPQAGLRLASQLPLFCVSSWEDTPTGQRAQIHASEQSASQEDTLSVLPDDASLRSAEYSGEWRQAGTAPGRDAVVHTSGHRHISRDRTSLNTAGHRTLRVLARPQSSALVAALYDAEHQHSVPHSALVLGPYGRPLDLARFGIVLLIIEDTGLRGSSRSSRPWSSRVNNTAPWSRSLLLSGKWKT